MYRPFIILFILTWPLALFAQDTALQLYRPFTETTNHPAIVVVATTKGECWQQSQHTIREDAWRCIAEGRIYDPCFVKSFGSKLEAVCPESPWSGNSIQITVSSPMDSSHHLALDMSRNYPWAVHLHNGEKCLAVDGGEYHENLPVRYRCDRQTSLIGHIQRCAATWKMLQHSSDGLSTMAIDKAWF